MDEPIAAVALNQPQMKNGPVLLSPNVIECGKLVRSHPAATECEVDLALMARSDERAQTRIPAERISAGCAAAPRGFPAGRAAPRCVR